MHYKKIKLMLFYSFQALILILLTNLFRLNSSHGAGVPPGEPAVVHDAPHQTPSAPDGVSRPSSDEGENEVGEENADRLDCHYSGSHPRPAAVSPHTRPPAPQYACSIRLAALSVRSFSAEGKRVLCCSDGFLMKLSEE